MMKRIRAIGITVVVIGAIVMILLRNKAASEAKAKSDVLSAPAVTVAPVATQQLGDTLSLVGTTVATNDVNVVSEAAGRIVAVHVGPGDRVEAGTVLMQIDDELKHAAVQTAQANYDKAKKDLERMEYLRKEKSAGDAQYEGAKVMAQQAEAALTVAKRQLADCSVKSPIAGVVTARMFDIGAFVPQNAVVANVVDIAKLKVRVNVAEGDAFRLHVGDQLAITSDVYPDATFTGTITSISAKGDEAHTYPVEITLPNNSVHPLKAGMFAHVTFTSLPRTESLTIPRAALVGSIRAPQVYVVENNTAHLRDVVAGAITDTRLAIIKGLNAGESVVVSGQNNLRDNVAVTVVQ